MLTHTTVPLHWWLLSSYSHNHTQCVLGETSRQLYNVSNTLRPKKRWRSNNGVGNCMLRAQAWHTNPNSVFVIGQWSDIITSLYFNVRHQLTSVLRASAAELALRHTRGSYEADSPLSSDTTCLKTSDSVREFPQHCREWGYARGRRSECSDVGVSAIMVSTQLLLSHMHAHSRI